MFHNSIDTLYKAPFGAVKAGTFVNLRLDVERKYKVCKLRVWTPDQREELYEMAYRNNHYELAIGLALIGIYWYVFILEDFDQSTQFYGCEQGYTAGNGECFNYFPRKAGFQITCYDKEFSTPEWFGGEILYQIFPDRFARESSYQFDTKKYKLIHQNWNEELGHTEGGADNYEFYAGNFEGIASKLDYLCGLQVKAIYLNPIFKASSNHRYDVTTWIEPDEMLGTEQDFKRMVKQCHEKGIHVILDISWNHVGADSIYFNKYATHGNGGAFHDPNSAYRGWFNVKEDGSYDSWWGIDSLPVLDKSNAGFRSYVNEVVEYWVAMEIDGFRIDVIDELPDNFLEWFRTLVKGKSKKLVILGEVWEDASLKKDWALNPRTYVYGKSQDSVMNYVLRNLLIDFLGNGTREKEMVHHQIDALTFYRKYMNLYSNYPTEIFFNLMNFLSTHDVNRALLLFGEAPYNGAMTKAEQKAFRLSADKYDLAVKRMKIAWSFVLCSIGTPSIFYGEESGLYGYNDPFNRRPMNWANQDMELLEWFRSINKIRALHPVTKNGNIKFLYAIGDVLAFERFHETEHERVLYMANRGNEPQKLSILGNEYLIDAMGYRIEFLK